MGKKVTVNLFKNKRTGQLVLTLPLKKFSKKMKCDLSKSKKIEISIDKFY